MISAGPEGIYIEVHVQPRARRTGVRGIHGGRLKVAVTEPPEGGRANEATVNEIARVLKVRSADVSLVSGTRSQRKRVLVRGLSVDDATRLIMEATNGST